MKKKGKVMDEFSKCTCAALVLAALFGLISFALGMYSPIFHIIGVVSAPFAIMIFEGIGGA